MNAVIGSSLCGVVGEVAPSGIDFKLFSFEANQA